MKRKQKTVCCPMCQTKHVLKARETKTGITYNYDLSRGKIKCGNCGHIYSVPDIFE